MCEKRIILRKNKEKIDKNENSGLNYLVFDSFCSILFFFLLIMIRFKINFIDSDRFILPF